MSISKTKYTSQYMDNMSFDETYEQNAVEMLVENTAGTALVRQKEIATEAKQNDLITAVGAISFDTTGLATEAKQGYPTGTDTDFSVTLTSASTAYTLFSAPAKAYDLVIYNGSDSDVYIRKTTGTTLGVLLPAGGTMSLQVGANKTLYAYCSSSGKILQGFYTLIN